MNIALWICQLSLGLLFVLSGTHKSLQSIETDGQRILAIRNVVNPDKLRGISPTGSS